MSCRVLILGATGMAGHILKETLEQAGLAVVCTSRDSDDMLNFNAFDVEHYDDFFNNIEVDFIINCIGVLVEQSSKYPHLAYIANLVLPKYLEAKFSKTQTKIIHISTDCVFSGLSGDYADTDIPDEKGIYGLSKSLGEINNTKDVTIRTSIIGPELSHRGSKRTGLLHWFLSLNDHTEISGFSRCFWSGISTLELSFVVIWALQPHIVGLVQVSRKDKISKYDLLCIFKKVFNKDLNISPDSRKFVDKSLIPSKNAYQIENDYVKMVQDLKKHIDSRSDLYSYSDTQMRLIGGMASIQRRESSLALAVESLAPQLDSLFIYLNDYENVPNWLLSFKNVTPILSKDAQGDLGDSGKFYKIYQHQGENVYFFTVDDDIIYPSDYVSNSVLGLKRYEGQALCSYHGRVFQDDILPLRGYFKYSLQKQKLLHFNADVLTDESVHFGGTGVMCFDLRYINIPSDIFNKEKNAADIFVGVYCQLKKIPIIVLAHRRHWLIPSPIEPVQGSIFGVASIEDSPVSIINRELCGYTNKLDLFIKP